MLLTHDYAYLSILEFLSLFCCKSSATAAVHDNYKVNKDLLSMENITDEVIDEYISHQEDFFTDKALEVVAKSSKFRWIHTVCTNMFTTIIIIPHINNITNYYWTQLQ